MSRQPCIQIGPALDNFRSIEPSGNTAHPFLRQYQPCIQYIPVSPVIPTDPVGTLGQDFLGFFKTPTSPHSPFSSSNAPRRQRPSQNVSPASKKRSAAYPCDLCPRLCGVEPGMCLGGDKAQVTNRLISGAYHNEREWECLLKVLCMMSSWTLTCPASGFGIRSSLHPSTQTD